VSGRVLVIAYYFPPLGGVGVQRTLKYVKYLPASGWHPVAVTPARPAYTVRDATLLDELPADLRVERTPSFEPARLSNAVEARLRRGRRDAAGLSTGAATAQAGADRPAPSGLRARLLMKGVILWNRVWGALLFPDAVAGWVGAATRRGLAIHEKTPVDVVYSTSGPISCHLIAGRIAARAGLPWVADFRDPWIGNAFATPPRGLNARRQRTVERKIVDGADRLIFPTKGVMEAYAERYPWAAGKMRVIPNGYDRADFPQSGAAADGASDAAGDGDGRRFRLVYTGSLYGDHELEIFLDGLELLVGRRPEVRDRLDVEFVGWLGAHSRGVAAEYERPDRLGSMVRFAGFVSHVEALRRASAADALLQLIADDPRKGEVQGGKLMEYLGQDKQILAAVPEGVAREVLRELDWGIVVDPTPEGVASGVERLLASPPPTRRADPEGRYDRVNLAARLAGCLDEVVAARHALTLAFVADPNSIHTRRWVGFFLARGHRVHLLVPSSIQLEPGLDPRIDVHVYRPWPRTHIRGLGSAITALELKRILRRVRPDVLHAHYLSWFGWAAWLSGFRPLVVTVWGSDVLVGPRESAMHRRWARRTLSRAALVTAVSEDLAREAVRLGARPERVRIVQFGFDPEVFTPMPPPESLRAAYGLEGHRVVLSPRGMTPLYRHEVAVEALARLPEDVVLLLVKSQARPEYVARLEELIRERGLEGRVRWLPPIPHESMADHYRLADVIVSLPSTDAFPVTALEAMACGVPVVMGDVPSAHEGLGAVDPSAIVPGDDPAAVAEAILARLSLDPAARADLGARLRKAAIDRGDVRRNLGGMEDAYRALALRR
jgi:glycosyltransferase involved in cell wall biosynthesis